VEVKWWARERKRESIPQVEECLEVRFAQEGETGEAVSCGRSLNDASSSSPVRNFSTPGSFIRGHIDVGATTPAPQRETSHNLLICFTGA
jgi:hypothetical protein